VLNTINKNGLIQGRYRPATFLKSNVQRPLRPFHLLQYLSKRLGSMMEPDEFIELACCQYKHEMERKSV
jgi:hypothetical protein